MARNSAIFVAGATRLLVDDLQIKVAAIEGNNKPNGAPNHGDHPNAIA